MKTQPESNSTPLNPTPALDTAPVEIEEAPLVEVTEMSMDDVMLIWDGQSAEFNEELRNRPETNCYGYWQKKLAEKQRQEAEAAKKQADSQPPKAP